MESKAADSKIKMTAIVNKSEVSSKPDGFTEFNMNFTEIYTRSWEMDEFGSEDMSLDDSGDLVLTKKISKGCVKTKVDDVTVCTDTGHTLDFKVSLT